MVDRFLDFLSTGPDEFIILFAVLLGLLGAGCILWVVALAVLLA